MLGCSGAVNWGTLFQLARWGLYVNLVIVAFNTGHFFMQQIPLPPHAP